MPHRHVSSLFASPGVDKVRLLLTRQNARREIATGVVSGFLILNAAFAEPTEGVVQTSPKSRISS